MIPASSRGTFRPTMLPRAAHPFFFALALVAILPSSALAQDADGDTSQAEADEAADESEEPYEPSPLGDDPGEDIVDTFGDAIGGLGDALGPDAQPHARIQWDPAWPRYRFDELVVTLGMGLVILLEELLPTRTDANWRGVTDFDLATASGLGLPTAFARDAVEEVSDALAVGLFIWPVVFDSLVYAGLGEGAWDVAWQLSLISLEVFSINQALNVFVRLLSRRERPLHRFCENDPASYDDPICDRLPAAESFWSPHVSNAFAGATLVCLHHDVLDLFGDEATDGLACASALAAAGATGVLRIMSDSQWVTDVLAGAVVGSALGLIVPWLLHYQGGARPPFSGEDHPTITFLPMIGDGVLGVSALGLL